MQIVYSIALRLVSDFDIKASQRGFGAIIYSLAKNHQDSYYTAASGSFLKSTFC